MIYLRYVLLTSVLTSLLPAQTRLYDGFSAGAGWQTYDTYPRTLADVNGDKKADIVGFASDGVYVALSEGSTYSRQSRWIDQFGTAVGGWTTFTAYPREMGDVNGDGKADIVGFASDGVYVSLSTGTAFAPLQKVLGTYATGAGGWSTFDKYPRSVADVNGDGKADIAGFASDGVYVALSTGAGFDPPRKWSEHFGANNWLSFSVHPRVLGDVDGDKRADIVGFASDGVYVASSTGASFSAPVRWLAGFGSAAGGWTDYDTYPRMVADYNGDGLGDVIGFGSDGTYVAVSTRNAFKDPERIVAAYGVNAGGWSTFNQYPRIAGDVDGDGRADVGGFAGAGVYLSFSTGKLPGEPYNRPKPYFDPTEFPAVPDDEPAVSIISNDGKGGRALCGGIGSSCPAENADYVGAYNDTSACPEGFYDPIYGGSCWKCPADTDSRGAWLRGTPHVEKRDACYRIPSYEKFSRAIPVKAGFSWDCSADEGEFWDSQNASGHVQGTCWKCPAEYPRRTAHAVHGTQACVTEGIETAPATFIRYLGCPTPTTVSMGLKDPRTPGKPFRHGFTSECYACPAVDDAGNIVVTQRNLNPLNSRTGNQGCNVSFKWQPPPFQEPGPGGLNGFSKVVMENLFSYPDHMTALLYAIAEENGLGHRTPQAKQWVIARWKEIATDPVRNEAVQAMVYLQLQNALSLRPQDRTAGEQALISSLEAYIRMKRTFLAQQGLYMFDTWKEREGSRYKTTLEHFRAFPQVPMDFHSTIATISGAAALPGGLLGAVAAGNRIASNVVWIKHFDDGLTLQTPYNTLYRFFTAGKIVQSAQFLPVITGAIVIEAAFAVIGAIAIEKFFETVTARDKLLAAVDQAGQPVVLEQFIAQPGGPDQVLTYYGQSMKGTTTYNTASLTRSAQKAHAWVADRGYPIP